MTTPPSSSGEEPFSAKVGTTFHNDLIREALRHHLTNPKNKITDDAVELMKVLVVEASVRSIKQAEHQNKTTVTLDHIESILPQLMLDFP